VEGEGRAKRYPHCEQRAQKEGNQISFKKEVGPSSRRHNAGIRDLSEERDQVRKNKHACPSGEKESNPLHLAA